MKNIDFGVHFKALGLLPGATDSEIARAKRAYNELYHSDRLSHMSGAAQAIAAEKVRAANEAAAVLLDPAHRSARETWVRHREAPGGPTAGPPSGAPSPAAPAPVERTEPRTPPQRSPRRLGRFRAPLLGIGIGGLLGAGAFVIQEVFQAARVAGTPGSDSSLARAPRPISPSPPAVTPVAGKVRMIVDSVIIVPGDGRWTPPVEVGGASWTGSFLPEPEQVMYRVRTNGRHEYVVNSEPGFRTINEPVQRYEFASLTGQPFKVRYSRWPAGTRRGRTLHAFRVDLPADGTWSRRVWLGPIGLAWDMDRSVAYETKDDEGRITRVPANVQSVAFAHRPAWIRFRSIDSLPLVLEIRYTLP